MYTYILILTLFISQSGFEGTNPEKTSTSISNIEFATKDACLKAAGLWVKQMKSTNRFLVPKALCVPKQ